MATAAPRPGTKLPPTTDTGRTIRAKVLGIYPIPDLPEQEIRIAQRLPYELGPFFMLGREFET